MKTAALFTLSLVTLLACSNKESDELAKAQDCLDKVSQTDPQQASSCLQYTKGYSSQRANEINCSIYIMSGGITTTRIASAYKVTQDSTITNKQASYIGFLALNLPDATTGYATAKLAQTYCEASGDNGLAFVANMAVIGSWANSFATSNSGSGFDFSNPSSVSSAVQTVVNACQSSPPAASCDADVIAPAVVTAATTYCATASADQTVCSTISQATAGNPTNDQITQALMCLLASKTWNPSTNTCT